MKTRVEPAVQKAIKDSKGGEDGEEEGSGGGSNLFKVEEFQLGSVKPDISNFKVHKAEDEDSKVWSPTHHLCQKSFPEGEGCQFFLPKGCYPPQPTKNVHLRHTILYVEFLILWLLGK